jgi:hypothetical protein
LRIAAETIDPNSNLLFQQPAHALGRLFGTIQNSVTAMTIFFYQCPPVEDVDGFLDQLHAEMGEWYPDPNIEPEILAEIVCHVATGLSFQAILPGWEVLRRGVCPVSTPQRMEIAYIQTWLISSTFLGGLVDSFILVFRQRWSNGEFHDFVAGSISTVRMAPNSQFLAETVVYPNLQPPLDFSTYLAGEDDAEVRYTLTKEAKKPVGPRIPMYVFCQLVLPADPGTQCMVCLREIDNALIDAEDEPVAAHGCKHLFHAACLDRWVNESAMPTAGCCPLCRTELCEARKLVEMGAEGERESNECVLLWD